MLRFNLESARQGGAEAAIHAVRRYAENLSKDYIIVKLDFKNTFSTLKRDTMLEAIRRELPELYNFAHATYNGAPVLQFGSSSSLQKDHSNEIH